MKYLNTQATVICNEYLFLFLLRLSPCYSLYLEKDEAETGLGRFLS